MATIKTLLGNVKGKDGGGYEEVVLYDGNCSACINWSAISADSPMMELSDSIENYKTIRIEFTSYMGVGTKEEGVVATSTTHSVNYIKQYYTHSVLECSTGFGNTYYSRQAFGFYDSKHLALTWESYSGWTHNVSHITVTGIRDRVSDAEKNFNKYSTTEEVVGTWIDGKPIYRKTMEFSNLSAGENNIPHGIADVDIIMVDRDHSFATNGTYSELWQIGNTNSSASNFSQFSVSLVWTTNSMFDVYIGSGLASRLPKLIITFEYTKTTS